MSDFIGIYDFGLEIACNKIIEFFEHEYDESKSNTSGLKYFNRNRQKICAT